MNNRENLARYTKDIAKVLARYAHDAELTDTKNYLTLENNTKNRNILTESVYKLVISYADKVKFNIGNRIDLDDLIQAGNEGSIMASDAWLSTPIEKRRALNASFSTYAYYYIKKYVLLEVDGLNTNEFLATSSIEDGNDDYLLLKLESTSEYTTALRRNDDLVSINSIFKSLSEYEKNILFLNYGIGIESSLSVAEIAKMYNVSIGKIHDIIKQSILKIRTNECDTDVINIIHYIKTIDTHCLWHNITLLDK